MPITVAYDPNNVKRAIIGRCCPQLRVTSCYDLTTKPMAASTPAQTPANR